MRAKRLLTLVKKEFIRHENNVGLRDRYVWEIRALSDVVEDDVLNDRNNLCAPVVMKKTLAD
jgi:hypothetical protein